MKITLIENGLDSLRKGYSHLSEYERLAASNASEKDRFSALKDSVLSIQHGVEILFKHALKEQNELLLFTDISKLKEAFKLRKAGEIKELYELEGVHTVSYKESIERLRDICNLPISEKLKKTLLKVEAWRNSITHSAVLLREIEVAKVLVGLLGDLDDFFGPTIGAPYLEGQGRTDLDRAYRLSKATYGTLENRIKAQAVEGLIKALSCHGIKNIGSPGTIKVTDAKVAYSILEHLQKNELTFGCDLINGHCSGSAKVTELSSDGALTIYTRDNECGYQFKLAGMLIYVPEINNNSSPLIFIYSDELPALGADPYINSDNEYKIQHGLMLDEENTALWEKSTYLKSYDEIYSENDPTLPAHKDIHRFLSSGPVCFMNIQRLQYGSAQRLMHVSKTIDDLHASFVNFIEGKDKPN